MTRFLSFHHHKSTLCILMVTVLAFASTKPADAQRRGLALVRDAEIEAHVKALAAPLMKAGNLRKGAVQFFIVDDPALNAFVSGRGMFVNTGLLLRAEGPGEVLGVIAHELGHIIGGHQIRLRERIDSAKRVARITSLLGVGIGAAAIAGGSQAGGAAGVTLAAGSRSFALRSLLRYQRDEESNADRTAARLLAKAGLSGHGMLKTFTRLAQDLSILGGRVDPYTLSHPLPNARIAALEAVLKKSSAFGKPLPASVKLRHDMVRAKIAGYTGGNRYARALLAGKELSAPARLYGRAIVAHLYGSPQQALKHIAQLAKQQPKNAYVHEMRGEILLRSAKAAEAAKSFRKAVALDRTGAGFLRVELGNALVQSGNPAALDEAIKQLRQGLASDPSAVAGYQYLAMAYRQRGEEARALLASAELAVRTGKAAQARQYAKRAQQSFKRGTPEWLRSQDIITYRP